MTDTGEVKYRVVGVRPLWPADPDEYRAHFDGLKSAIEDAKERRDDMQSFMEVSDECNGESDHEGLPYVIVEESYVDEDGDVHWEEVETYATHCPTCEYPPTDCRDTQQMNAGERNSLTAATGQALWSMGRAMPYPTHREDAVMLFTAAHLIRSMDPTAVCEAYYRAEAVVEEDASKGQIGHAHHLDPVAADMLFHAAQKEMDRAKRHRAENPELDARHPIESVIRRAERKAALFLKAADAL
ncbi:MAG: hypothetical protein OXE96_16275 [Gemmatimonadetes bacterium]|nr:hypothetical protein [Gemmatimonadota bacterium]